MFKRSMQVFMILATAMSGLPARAQESGVTVNATDDSAASATSSASTQQSDDGAKVERVEVTGSHIKRLSVEGASPVQTVTHKDLEKSGYNSVSDVLRDTGSASFGGQREASGSNAAGVAHVDLRGLGADSTLVLLNGQRLPTDAVTGAVDLNMIPMAAVDRVEILKDGASAIYGSDALGGVVNIITKKDYQGTEAHAEQSVPSAKGGARTDIGLVNGYNSENLNVVTVGQFRNNDTVFARDRFWTATNQSLTGGPGSYRGADGKWIADANCPAGRIVTTPQGTFCSFNPADFMTQLPALQQMSVSSEANYQASSAVKVTARAGGTRRAVNWSYAAAPGTFKIDKDAAAHLGAGGTPLPGADPNKDLNIRYRLTELGTRDADVTTYGYNFLLGSEIQVTNDWTVGVNISHNGISTADKGANGYALKDKLEEAIKTGAYNPFAPDGQKGSLAGIRYTPVENTASMLTSLEAKTSGPLAQLDANDQLSLAVGSTVTRASYRDDFDSQSVRGNVVGNAGSSGNGQRISEAAYAELSLPVFNAGAELQLAGRFDNYSDFGHTFNPKAALLLRPTSFMLLRGSIGTGFKAPLMQEMYAATSDGNPTFIDYVACNAEKAAGGDTPSCTPQQYQVTSGGNPGLREEKSVSANVGLVIEPSKHFSIGGDVFATRIKNKVGIDYSDAMLAESKGVDLAAYGVQVVRDSQGYLDHIVAPLQNLSAQHLTGADLSATASVSDFKLVDEYSQLFHFQEEGFPGTGMVNKIDQNGRPRWRNTTALSFNPNDNHDVTLAAMTIAGQEKIVAEEGRIPNFTTLDLSYTYRHKAVGAITVGVKNLLGSTPPLDDSNPSAQLNTDLYDQIGRQFIVGYSKSF